MIIILLIKVGQIINFFIAFNKKFFFPTFLNIDALILVALYISHGKSSGSSHESG